MTDSKQDSVPVEQADEAPDLTPDEYAALLRQGERDQEMNNLSEYFQ